MLLLLFYTLNCTYNSPFVMDIARFSKAAGPAGSRFSRPIPPARRNKNDKRRKFHGRTGDTEKRGTLLNIPREKRHWYIGNGQITLRETIISRGETLFIFGPVYSGR